MAVVETPSRQDESTESEPGLATVRRLLADRFAHRPLVYWLDFLASAAIGWTAFAAAVLAERPIVGGAAVVLSAFAFLRAVLFIHEIAHFRRGAVPGFTLAWNALVGVPLVLPSFLYETHLDHHRRHLFGTAGDPEYLPLARGSRAGIVRFIAEVLLAPAFFVLRFLVLAPLSFSIPPLRPLVVGRVSALVINQRYVRAAPKDGERRRWLVQEAAAFVWILAWTVLIATGRAPLRVVLVFYAVTALVALVNQVRTLAAHVYDNAGGELSVTGQLLDSVNVRGWPLLTDLVFPVGLKYHALHHWIPDLPYHALPDAHRLLLRELPEGAAYRRTVSPGLWMQIARLWRRAGRAGAEG